MCARECRSVCGGRAARSAGRAPAQTPVARSSHPHCRGWGIRAARGLPRGKGAASCASARSQASGARAGVVPRPRDGTPGNRRVVALPGPLSAAARLECVPLRGIASAGRAGQLVCVLESSRARIRVEWARAPKPTQRAATGTHRWRTGGGGVVPGRSLAVCCLASQTPCALGPVDVYAAVCVGSHRVWSWS